VVIILLLELIHFTLKNANKLIIKLFPHSLAEATIDNQSSSSQHRRLHFKVKENLLLLLSY